MVHFADVAEHQGRLSGAPTSRASNSIKNDSAESNLKMPGAIHLRVKIQRAKGADMSRSQRRHDSCCVKILEKMDDKRENSRAIIAIDSQVAGGSKDKPDDLAESLKTVK
ncbi:uncharacterized protein BT62DRAFT_768340 [Guyanagaster necrorhizus]|uniref:Uncharacterized protein n=1 Tax=Guyanagaster necrorhizus TaxID=856835 RepID=A0A9P8ALX3_9AGAR|nr:uncharacterized protein BT62DRAFT_768340 [Guyanagaster necrorhizus MCA 3950]KAG7439282.1 hypothetical protein BT62DRAFT_768340 [Guyanagaster necrorhizus MCA 3950]